MSVRILGISGSLRRKSLNTMLLRAAEGLVGEGTVLEAATLHGIPLYDGDLEEQDGIPPGVVELKERIVACDGLLLVTPEYNNSIPGVFKNAIDWLSRPPADAARIFSGRPVAVIGASPGGFGTILAQNAWLPVLRTLGTRHWAEGRLMVSRASKVFAEDGALVDDGVREQLRKFLQGFAAFAASHASATASATSDHGSTGSPRTEVN
jgi:chromate reductase, NAD(P)H dehydrogenase (quinone)